MKELIFSFFENRVTPLQKREVDKWLKEEENKRAYLQWLEEWENQNPEYQPNVENPLAKFVAFMKEHTQEPHKREVTLKETTFLKRKESKTGYRKFFAAAAAVLFLMGIGGWAFKDYFLYRQYKTSYGEIRTLMLEDGSQATLNGNSYIKVPRWNFKQHREVYLKGEAIFSVARADAEKQFVVKTDHQFEVKVMGTEFSVLSRDRGARVYLTKGKVEVEYIKDNARQSVTMKSGEVMMLDDNRDSGKSARHLIAKDSARMIWEYRRFEFTNVTLNEVADMLRDTYGLDIKLANATLGKQKLFGSYTADNVEDLLQAIGEVLDVYIEREGNQVSIKH